jgi:hypothetical protein
VTSRLKWLGLALACTVCCAPVFMALAGGAGLMATLSGLHRDEFACGVLAIVALTILGYGFYARKGASPMDGCGCEPARCPEECGPNKADLHR